MSGLREQLAHDLAVGDMSESATEETALDRIGALARSDPLGAALWRVVGNMDAGSFISARGILTLRLWDGRLSEHWCSLVAQLAMEEWLACQCETCGGRKFVIRDATTGTRSTCPDCHGTGRGRHSDVKRMEALGVGNGQYAQLTRYFVTAHDLLNKADARVERQLSYQLERKPLKRKV